MRIKGYLQGGYAVTPDSFTSTCRSFKYVSISHSKLISNCAGAPVISLKNWPHIRYCSSFIRGRLLPFEIYDHRKGCRGTHRHPENVRCMLREGTLTLRHVDFNPLDSDGSASMITDTLYLTIYVRSCSFRWCCSIRRLFSE